MSRHERAAGPTAGQPSPDAPRAGEEAGEPRSPEETPRAEAGRLEDAAARGEAPAEADELRDRWLRAEADLQNFRRRAQRDLEEAVRAAEDRLLLDSIAQLDDLERALSLAGEAEAPEAWVDGVRLVAARMLEDLRRRGVRPIEAVGQPFDPRFHEALLETDSDAVEPGHVAQVVLTGYERNGRALRAARVVVARAPEH